MFRSTPENFVNLLMRNCSWYSHHECLMIQSALASPQLHVVTCAGRSYSMEATMRNTVPSFFPPHAEPTIADVKMTPHRSFQAQQESQSSTRIQQRSIMQHAPTTIIIGSGTVKNPCLLRLVADDRMHSNMKESNRCNAMRETER